MPLTVVISGRAERNLQNIVAYLDQEWSIRIRNKFIAKLNKVVLQISIHPYLFPESGIKQGIRKCIDTPISVNGWIVYNYSMAF